MVYRLFLEDSIVLLDAGRVEKVGFCLPTDSNDTLHLEYLDFVVCSLFSMGIVHTRHEWQITEETNVFTVTFCRYSDQTWAFGVVWYVLYCSFESGCFWE